MTNRDHDAAVTTFQRLLHAQVHPDLMAAVDPLCRSAEQAFAAQRLSSAQCILAALLFAASVISETLRQADAEGAETPPPVVFEAAALILVDMLYASQGRPGDRPASHATH